MRKGTKFTITKYGKVWELISLKKFGDGCVALAPLKYADGKIRFDEMIINASEINK